jgi:type IV pilus assembly protein PilA
MNKKGFTLVEIMIVVAIIGLLAAIGIPSIIGAYGNAQEKSIERNIADIEKAKGMLTLPPPMGSSYTNGQAVDAAAIVSALNISAITDLKVGTKTPTIGAIGTRCSYN